jgi:PST family polysaccharide transporter
VAYGERFMNGRPRVESDALQRAENDTAIPRLDRWIEQGSATRAGKATLWASATALFRQGATFIGLVVLARLLDPEAFGLYTIVMAVSALGLVLTELGLGSAIVTGPIVTRQRLDTAFWLNAAAGLLLTLLVVAVARPLAALYGTPELEPLLYIVSSTFALSLGTVQLALLERNFSFARIFATEVTAVAIAQLSAVILAIHGAGPISLAIIGPTTAIITTLGVWLSVPWRPSGRVDKSHARDLWKYCKHLVAFNATNYWARNLDNLTLPVVASPAVVGLYGRAYSLMMLPLQQISTVISRVLLPVLSRAQDDPVRFRRAWADASKLSWAVGLPAAATLAVAAPEVVAVVLGDQWQGATVFVIILAVAIPPQLVTRTSGSAYQGIGRPDLQLRFGLICTALTVVAICVGLYWGAIGVAIGVTLSYFGHGAVVCSDLPRRLGLKPVAYLLSLLPPLLAAVAACGVGMASRQLWQSLPAFIGLTLAGLIISVVYVGVSLLLDRKWLLSTFRRLRHK